MLHPFPGPPRCFFLISPRHGPRVHPDPSRSTQDAYSDKELHLWSVAFSADSQQFAVATTHGVFVYSQDAGGIAGISGGIYGGDSRFVPQILTKAVSAPAVLKALEDGEISKAMILALALNDYALLRKVYEQVPVSSIELVVASIGAPLLPALLRMSSGRALRTGSLESSSSDVAALCLQLLVELSQRHAGMSKIFEKNTYSLRFLGSVPSETGDEEVGNEGKEIKEETKPAPDLEEEAEAEAPLVEEAPDFSIELCQVMAIKLGDAMERGMMTKAMSMQHLRGHHWTSSTAAGQASSRWHQHCASSQLLLPTRPLDSAGWIQARAPKRNLGRQGRSFFSRIASWMKITSGSRKGIQGLTTERIRLTKRHAKSQATMTGSSSCATCEEEELIDVDIGTI
eukprot:g2515.t1